MFAQVVAILRDIYPEISHLKGVCNQRISRMRAKVNTELPENAIRQGLGARFCAVLRMFCGLFASKFALHSFTHFTPFTASLFSLGARSRPCGAFLLNNASSGPSLESGSGTHPLWARRALTLGQYWSQLIDLNGPVSTHPTAERANGSLYWCRVPHPSSARMGCP